MRSSPVLFKHFSTVVAAVLGAAIVFWSLPAVAAGFFLPTRGVESTARGGATIAPHEAKLDSLWHNPAGLSLIDDYQLNVELATVDVRVEHQRAPREMDDGSTRTYEPVTNQALPNPIPSVMVGGPTRIDEISWAAGVYTYYAGSDQYDVDGPQRYALVDNSDSTLGFVHAAIGIELSDEISVGIGLQNFMADIRVVTVGSGYVGMFGDPEDEDLDILSDAQASNYFSPTGNFGITYQPTEQLQTGLSIQLPQILSDDEVTVDTRLPEHPAYDGMEVTDNRVQMSSAFPFYVRGGIRYLGENFDVEGAVVYQHWSILDEVTMTPVEAETRGAAVLGEASIPPMTVPYGFRNTFSAHLGGEYDLNESFDIRGGYVFERSAVPDHRYSVMTLDPDKHQFSAGLGYDRDAWNFHVTGAAIVMPTRVIRNSEFRQNTPADPERETALIVGNGTYEHFGYIFGLGTEYTF